MPAKAKRQSTPGSPTSLRRLLVGLDGSPWSRSATTHALAIARASGASATGLAIIDRHDIDHAVGPVPMGALHFAEERERTLLGEARQHATALARDFKARCDQEKVVHTETSAEGVPFEHLILESMSHDLIVIGLRTFFHYPPSTEPGETLQKLLHHGMRPVLAVRETAEPIRHITIAVDPSPQSGRALQLFALLRPWGALTVRLVHAGDDRSAANQVLQPATAFLQAHGIEARPAFLEGHPTKVIPEDVKRQKPDLVVMGAYGKATVRKLLFGSLTATLLERATVSLLLSS